MPKQDMDYSKTIIYKIVCNDLSIEEVYVGHTTSWKQRKSQHKQSIYNKNVKGFVSKKSTFIREHGGWDNWDMIEVEKFPCNDKQEALARERYWYEKLHAKLNTNVPNRNMTEYNSTDKTIKRKQNFYNANRTAILEKQKTYNIQNVDIIKKYRAHTFECECGSIIQCVNKGQHYMTLKHCEYIKQKLKSI
jgi:predicted GIY-YIG superfamily endonuclease